MSFLSLIDEYLLMGFVSLVLNMVLIVRRILDSLISACLSAISLLTNCRSFRFFSAMDNCM